MATVKESVENKRTSPDWDRAGEEVAWGDDGCMASVEVGEGTGEGYARYDASADGERAHMAGEIARQLMTAPSEFSGTTHLQGSE